MTYTIYWKITS